MLCVWHVLYMYEIQLIIRILYRVHIQICVMVIMSYTVQNTYIHICLDDMILYFVLF